MILVKEITTLKKHILQHQNAGEKIGFVPTMGALHAGHIALVDQARAENDVTVCSIFINPAQFNNAADLELYPVKTAEDIDMLEKAGLDILFLPSVQEIYPAAEVPVHYDLGFLENTLEGKFRPGHFQGVCRVVDKLLTAVEPTTLYLGRKDYQQCIVIAKMMRMGDFNIVLKICDTVREPGGLAMSSRNLRLNDNERKKATCIYGALANIKTNMLPGNIEGLKKDATFFLEKNGFAVDYAEIADAVNLEPIVNWDGRQKAVALIAAYLNDIRLIDNIVL